MNRTTETYGEMLKNLEGYFRQILNVKTKDGRRELRVRAIQLPPVPAQDDFEAQKRARSLGLTMSKSITADMELVEGGKVIESKRVTLLSVPEVTQRGTYIVQGTEYSFPIQKRLISGVYATKNDDGSVKCWINSEAGRNYTIHTSPDGSMIMEVVDKSGGGTKTYNTPLYPTLLALGITDQQMVTAWGEKATDIQRKARNGQDVAKAIETLYRALRYETDPEAKEPTPAGHAEWVKTYLLNKSSLDKLNSEILLGKPYERVSPELLLDAGTKSLSLIRGEAEEDNKESMLHAQFVDLGDFAVERMNDREYRSAIKGRITRGLETRAKLDDIVYKDVFQAAFSSTFTGTSLARTPKQLNPMDMISGYTEITVRGEGGIQTDQAVTKDVRALDPSHLGFIDPVHTPEGSNIGTTLHIATGARKRGRELVTRVYDVKTGQEVELTPREFYLAPIAYSESWDAAAKKLKTTPEGTVQVMWKHRDQRVKPSEVRYAMRSISDMINVNALAIPFLTHNNGTRVMTASKMQAQAKPLLYREPPLVQCTINEKSDETVEQVVGRSFCPKSPEDGVVTKVTDILVTIKSASGKSLDVQIPKKFWLNEGNFVDGVVIVKVGDRVKKGQPLADTNYTRNGTLALGVNLNVAYVPYKGYNHEDGVVISEAAATKLTSLHAHQHPIPIAPAEVLDLKKYQAYFPMSFNTEQLSGLDAEGVVKEGARIKPGDPLVVKMRKVEEDVTSKQLRNISRLLASDYRDSSVLYDKDHVGVVSEVTRRRGELFIVITTEERARIGDKLVGRYGNKGTVTMILPDDKMPRGEGGAPLDIMINPPGVPARMNPGQLLETNAARVAEIEGKTFLARPSGENGTAKVEDALKKHKLSDATTLYDPIEDREIPGVSSGKQYFFKLEHTVEKKLSARGAGDDEAYSMSGQPSSGGGTGGRAVGLGEVYALLAHGANANLRDMYTFKGDKSPEFWRALEKGYPLPPPDQPSSSKRLVGMLRGAGVDIQDRDGVAMMTPFLDRDIKKITNGEIKSPGVLRAADLKEEKGGLFDIGLTGGLEGERWTHIRLAEPMPHPTFERSIMDLTRLKSEEFDGIMSGELGVLDGKVVPAAERGAVVGGPGIRALLSNINVDERIKQAEADAKLAKNSDLNRLHRELRVLRNLRDNGIKPSEFVVDLVPVIPPKFRPVAELPNSDLTIADVNEHYRALVMMNEQVKDLKTRPGLSEQERAARFQLYDGFKGTMGYSTGLVGKPNVKGLTATIAGSQPKHGWFQEKTIRRRQDMSGTAVVEPEPALSMDTIGVPEEMAWTMYKPLLVRRLGEMGLPKIEADRLIQARSPAAQKALGDVMEKHHVIANRAPTLHRLGMMAFKPKLVSGSAIKLPVEVLTGFNADFDGDTFGIHVVVSPDANEEAKRMLPSNNLYMPGKNRQSLAPQITQEFVLGLYRITVPGRTTAHKFATPDQAIKAMESQQVKPNDIITVNGIGPATRTTAGLVAAMAEVPQPLRDYQTPLDKKQIEKLLTATERQFGTAAFVKLMDHLKHLGRRWAFLTGASILLSDMKSLSKTRDQLYREADKKADVVRRDGKLSQAEKDKRLIEIYGEVDSKILSQAKNLPQNSTGTGRNNLSDQVVSGARGNPNQVKQIVGTLGLMLDHNQKTIPEPVRGNYVDGLSSRDFFAHAYSQRKGMIDRSQSVIGPGALSKELTNTASRFSITTMDCKTQLGRVEKVDRHLLDRVLAKSEGGVAKGTVIDEKVIETLRKANLAQVYVRSPLSCEAQDGICSMCFGHDETGRFPPVGKNVGITETQSLTERSVQLPMKSFHSGGVATAEGGVSDAFSRAVQILRMPDTLKVKAVLSERAGQVQSVTPNGLGGHVITVAGRAHTAPATVKPTVKVGDQVQMGDKLTTGAIKPQELLALRDITSVQTQVRDDLHDTFASADVKLHKRTYEIMTRGITDTVRVSDPGDCPNHVTGDYTTFARVNAWNTQNPTRRQIKFTHEIAGSLTAPKRQEDWATRMALGGIKQTIQDGASMGYKSTLKPGTFAWLSMGPGTKIRKPGEEFAANSFVAKK